MQEDNGFETNMGYRPDCVTDSDPVSKIKSKQQQQKKMRLNWDIVQEQRAHLSMYMALNSVLDAANR